MQIGIFEILWHHVFLYTLALVANESGAKVTIFTTEKLYKLVKSLFGERIANYRWIIKNRNESFLSYLRRVEKLASNDLDLLFVNTIQGYWSFPLYMFKPRCKSILVTGRIEDWFGNNYKLLSFEPLKLIRHNLTHFARQRILPRYDGIVVHSKEAKKYVLSHGYNKNIFVLPFSIYEGDAKPKKDYNRLVFVVLGMIRSHRRDYDGVLNAFESLFEEGYKDLTITLLGPPVDSYSERIIERCNSLKARGLDIRYFCEYVPEEIYSEEVRLSDVIINPIRLENYQHGGFNAVLVEAIRNAKPGIYPSRYIVPDELLSNSLFYHKIDELADLIKDNFLNNRTTFKKLLQKSIYNSEKLSLIKVKKYFQKNLLS